MPFYMRATKLIGAEAAPIDDSHTRGNTVNAVFIINHAGLQENVVPGSFIIYLAMRVMVKQ